MKRGRNYSYSNKAFKRPRTVVTTTRTTRPAFIGPINQPRRAYAGSLVPLRSGGYTPNRIERKAFDINSNVYQVNTTGSFTLLANPVLGSDFNQRIGRKITLKSVYIRGYLTTQKAATPATSTPTATQQGRFIIFADLQPNGAVPAITDLLAENFTSGQLNLNNRDRFKIYCDKEFVFDPFIYTTTATQAVASANRQIYSIKKFKRINLETIFNATNGGTIADINSGALYMFWLGSSGVAADDVNAVLSCRVRYADA